MIPEAVQMLLGGVVSVTLARGSLIFCLALAVTASAWKLRGEVRHLVWVGVIGGFILVPIAWLALPSIDLGLSRAPAAHLSVAAAAALSRLEYSRVTERTTVEAILTLGTVAKPLTWIPTVLVAAWLAGALIMAGRFAMSLARLGRLARGGGTDPVVHSLGARVAASMELRGPVRIVLTPGCLVPFSFGPLRPVVVLPADCGSWAGARLIAVLTHEIAHLKRRDLLVQAAAYAVCILFWFAPPVWLAYAAMIREAETCCDQQVIDRGVQASEYARGILEVARAGKGRMLLSCTTAPLGLKAMIKDRITRLLALRPTGRPFRTRDAARVMLLVVCCLAPVLTVFATAEGQPLSSRDPFFGTWVNTEYDTSARFSNGKLVIERDGHEFDYRHIVDPKPYGERWNTVEKAWVDSTGRHWYRYKVVQWCGPSSGGNYEGFGVARISPDGSTIETVFAEYGYPDDVTPLGSYYAIAYRQR